MSIAVTRTKIHVPRRRADLLSRPRLNSALLDILDYPFTLISAPAGYGKTSLMIDLAIQASHPVCWYSIDPLDKEPKRFLAHLIHAIKLEFPEFGKPSLDLLENLPDPLSSPDEFICTLINDIYASITENYVIFLDDFHLLDDQPQIHGFISCFGQQMDENTHLVISSRNLFNFPDLPLLIGRKLVKGVDLEDLAFQPQELREYFQKKLHQPLSNETAEEMVSNTAGWITGLLLGKDNQESWLPDQYKAAKISGADLNSYFYDQVFQKQPDPVRKLMLRTSFFDEFNTTFCKQVLGDPEGISWKEFLDELIDHNLFVEQIEDAGIWVRYHHLFRDFLRIELEEQLPGEKEEILTRLVSVRLEGEDWEKAFDAAHQLADPQKMAEVIELAFSPLFHAGRIKLLSEWLEALPEDGYFSRPILVLVKGIAYTSLGDPQKGLEILSEALNNKEIRTNKDIYYRGLLCKSTTCRLMGKYPEALACSQKILDSPLEDMDKVYIEAEALREAALCKNQLGQYRESLKFLGSSLKSYEQTNDKKNSALVHADFGFILMNHGKLAQSMIHLEKAQWIWTSLNNYSQLSNLYNNLAVLYVLNGDYCEANRLLTLAEDYSIRTNNIRMYSFILGSKGDLASSLLKYSIAIDLYKDAEKTAIKLSEGYLLSYLPISRAKCLHNLNQITKAEEILKRISDLVQKGTSQLNSGLWHLETGYVHLAQGALNDAGEAFQAARDIFSEVSQPYEQAKACLGSCLVARNGNQKGQLEKALSELDALLEGLETFQPLVPDFSHYRDWLQETVSSQPSLENCAHCLDEIDHYLQRLPSLQERIFPHSAMPSKIESLKIQAFGDIRVSRGEKSITASEWIHQKTVREIFFYLLSHPQGITKERVGLAFWPDSSPSQLNCQFKNAIYRLRRALGKETVIYNQEMRSYSFNRDRHYTYDVEEFQEACDLAEIQPREDQRVENLRRAVSIYKHPFAPQVEGIWAEPLRRNLYLEYENAQLEIAAYDLKNKNYLDCRDACLAVLEIEPCQEKAYQLCMESYYFQGDVINIRRTYSECKSNLLNILNIEPSSYTDTLFKRLINS